MQKRPACSILFFYFFIFFDCSRQKTDQYSYNQSGYYFRLLAFEPTANPCQQGDLLWISATFKTQSDSVFWDSFNNLNDNYFIKVDTLQKNNMLSQALSKLSLQDSVCILINKIKFFKQQFSSSEQPFFCKNDSVVKINLKVKETVAANRAKEMMETLRDNEMNQIRAFYKEPKEFIKARDSLGFYWVTMPKDTQGQSLKAGCSLKINYTGYYLNGRFLEKSPKNFELIYGTPDQLLKGLNSVLRRIKLGQNAKIILPSRLAFGEFGSSNGTVPPYTPLLYEIEIHK